MENAAPHPVRTVNSAIALAGAVLVLATLALFNIPYSEGYGFTPISLWATLATLWSDKKFEDWHHGAIVPLISIGLLIYERKKILATPLRPTLWGLPIIALALVLYWFGYRASSHYIGWFAYQLLLAGGILFLLGLPMMKTVFFPWAFLVFAWPLVFLTEHIAVPLRHLMAGLSSVFLNLVGVATLKVGTSLHSATQFAADGSVVTPSGALFQLDVADPCSGIRSLFAIVMVSAIFGYLTLRKWWKRVALIVCSIPLVVAGNFARMLLLTFGTMWFGSEFAIGKSIEEPSWYHLGAGFAVFGVALLGMLGVQKLLDIVPENVTELIINTRDKETSEAKTAGGSRSAEGDTY